MRDSWKVQAFLTALLVALSSACGGPGEDPTEGGPDETAEEAGPVVSPDSAATITGTVAFEGTPPTGEAIDMSEEPTCAEAHAEPAMRIPAVVADGRLGNVYVYVKEGLPDLDWPTPSEGATLDQEGCEYHPHVLAIQVDQPLVIQNSDGILHNINTQPTANQGFNISQPVEMETTREFSTAEVMIPVKCDVHGWMEAYIGVQEHPYAAVTDEGGAFTLSNLPPGDYVIEAWHETYGTQTQNVTVGAQETAEVSFTFSSDMAGAYVPLGEPIDLHDHGDSALHGSRTPVASAGR
ncbi:MAG TPA: carboxypeptidase regulatory-like domain-containing protein [Gemmatimonadota bacterium]|nr:carboxypeptidase regulatory-like domain-containing protein [Gemmatimonadota bacterium]